MLSAVIFDFDGVIVDSEPLHYRALQAVLKPQDMGFSWEEYCHGYLGYADRDIFRMVFEARGEVIGPGDLNQLIDDKARAFQRCVHDGSITPCPGVVELIKNLGGQFPLALCSGGTSRDILPILGKLGIDNAFDTIVTAEDTRRSKPDPAPYLLTIRKLGLADAATAIAIEDTTAGIASAKGAGLKVLAVTNSYPREHLLESDAVTDSLDYISRQSLECMIF